MLSIIIPGYKGALTLKNNLPDFIEYLNKKNIHHEIIIVDDGSNDSGATKQIAKEFGCIYLQNNKNIGKGAAVRKGMLDFLELNDDDEMGTAIFLPYGLHNLLYLIILA